ncbi:hypothetical protein HPP92_021299 [Vanilla planifolia]|uniref:Uncharacterized protein n=1 Tax=Vanilla planifolia TaxID=51239 RepID=A0A835UGP0_VANPL|nr:hypothetical protein HPP92_021299 [Vanilla planifolia]
MGFELSATFTLSELSVPTAKITCLYVSQSYPTDCFLLPEFPAPVSAIYVNDLTGEIITAAGVLLGVWSINGDCLAVSGAVKVWNMVHCSDMEEFSERNRSPTMGGLNLIGKAPEYRLLLHKAQTHLIMAVLSGGWGALGNCSPGSIDKLTLKPAETSIAHAAATIYGCTQPIRKLPIQSVSSLSVSDQVHGRKVVTFASAHKNERSRPSNQKFAVYFCGYGFPWSPSLQNHAAGAILLPNLADAMPPAAGFASGGPR